jgi:LysM repeat protein
MPSRRPARLMAPLALVAAAAAVVLVVQSSGTSSKGTSSPAVSTSTSTSTRTGGRSTPTLTSRPPRHSYTVKAGDTLSGIAQATGVSLSRIEALNPHVDAGALRTGQKLKLAP